MNAREFSIYKEEVKNLLNKHNLLKDSYFYKKPLSKKYVKYKKKDDFILFYNNSIQNFDYHFLLFDNSFIQLEFDDKKPYVRYLYCPFPYDFLTFEEFLTELENDNVIYEEPEFIYDQLLEKASLKEPCFLIRYDYEELYNSGIHSVSHIHIGCKHQIRITTSTMITPLCFIMFILKQIYIDKWPMFLRDNDFVTLYKRNKRNCDNIQDNFFNELDKSELYLL